tara:strand:+ start:2253 stop:3677 length:1425 start_codon:yes stop_codon:yes gene_type:complete
LLFFLVHNDTLSVFKKSTNNDAVHLELKVKFHHKLKSIDNNSKLLSSVIAQALDELGEKISLENQKAAIVVDDNILSHSISRISQKNQIEPFRIIKEEIQIKWRELSKNYFSISESKKSSKNLFHTVSMNHYLREKIKLNFNNSGIDIKYLVPLSSVVLSGVKNNQFAVSKSSRTYSIFNYSTKGFSFFRGSFTGKNKGFKTVIGLVDLIKFKEKDFKVNNLTYIIFNDMKIVEFFARIVKDSSPILNFVKPFGLQILNDEQYKKTINISEKNSNFNFTPFFRNVISGVVTLGLVALALLSISDFNFLYNESSSNKIDSNVLKVKTPLNNLSKFRNSSYAAIDEFRMINLSDNMVKIERIDIVDNRVWLDTKSNDGISGGYLIRTTDVNSIDTSILTEDLITIIESLDNENQYKIVDGIFYGDKVDNIIIRTESIEASLKILNEVIKYNNLLVRKISYSKNENSVHLYVSSLVL